MSDPFIWESPAPLLSQSGIYSGLVANDQQKAVVALLAPGIGTLQQLQVAVIEPITVGSITVELLIVDLDDLAAGPSVVLTLTLTAANADSVKLLALALDPRHPYIIVVTASANLAGGGTVVGTLAGLLS